MERENRLLSPMELDALLPELLSSGATVPLVVTGKSMMPFLRPGRDKVLLSAPDAPALGDIVLYRRSGGRLALHRIVGADECGFILLGDAQQMPEPGISPDAIVAVVSAVERKGKFLNKESPVWLFYAKVWPGLLRFRPYLIRLWGRMHSNQER